MAGRLEKNRWNNHSSHDQYTGDCNEPETSLHPDLLPALARLILEAANRSQLWVVSHSVRLIAALESQAGCNSLRLTKDLGETHIAGQGSMDAPPWQWPAR